MKKKNCIFTVKPTQKNGKKYDNYVVVVTLENGQEVKFQVKLAFYNRKFDSLLKHNLPIFRGGDNADE